MRPHSLRVLGTASLMLGAGLTVGAAELPAQATQATRARQPVTGRVTGPDRAPVMGAEVALLAGDSVLRAMRSDSAGRFAFEDAAGPARSLRVRRLGYASRILPAVTPADLDSLADIALEAVPAALDEIHVFARGNEPQGKLREFYAHQQRAQFGYFFGPAHVQRERPRLASDLLRRVPGAQLLPSGRFGNVVRLRGCRPLVWVDGVRLPGAELDEVVNANDVSAMEVYGSLAGTPAEYGDRRNPCGTIVVWLKTS